MSEIPKNKTLKKTDSLSKYLISRAKDSLLTYTQLTYPKYRANWHHELIINHLETVAAGDIRRLMILVPRYGKSELSSIRFPAWYLGRSPEKKVILASYNDRFALHFGKHARNLCQSDMHGTVFPGAHVRKDSSSGSLWELCQSQRYGQGMTVGTLVHSEVWNNLEMLEYESHLKTRAFRVIIAVDEVFRDYAMKAQDRKMKRGSKPEGKAGAFTV